MIIPARWFSGGKNLDSFRDSMLNDNRIKEIHDFWNAADCFPGVEIKGGVCYFLWDKEYKGDCYVVTREKNDVTSEMVRPLLEGDNTVFIRQNEAVAILKKVKALNEASFSSVVYSAMTFGLRTFYKKFDSQKPGDNLVKLYANHSQGYINIEKIKRGKEYIGKWKVFVPEAVGAGDTRTDVLKPILGEPNSISTETYIMNGPWNSEQEAKNVIDYISTKFFHFFLGIKKITQHTTSKVYEFVPMQDFSQSWTDEKLYKKYNLTKEEIDYIESTVWPDKESGINAD